MGLGITRPTQTRFVGSRWRLSHSVAFNTLYRSWGILSALSKVLYGKQMAFSVSLWSLRPPTKQLAPYSRWLESYLKLCLNTLATVLFDKRLYAL